MAKRYRTLKKPVKTKHKNYQKEIEKEELKEIISGLEAIGEDALEGVAIGGDIESNIETIQKVFEDCYDFVLRKITIGEEQIKGAIAYISGMIDKETVIEAVLNPLTTETRLTRVNTELNTHRILEFIENSSVPVGGVQKIASIKEAVDKIVSGNCVLFLDSENDALSLSVQGWKARNVDKPETEPVIRGPLEGFVEDVRVNTSLLRKRIRTPNFKMEKYEIGRISKTDVVVCYVKGIADEGILREIKKRLENIDIDVVIESGYIEHLLEDHPLSPFPQVGVTERPDTCTSALAEGRFVVMVDGSPFVLVVPNIFVHFLTASEDYYVRFYFATFTRLLRYLAFFITLLGPSLYIAITTYHQEMIPTSLLISFLVARAEVPFPAIMEAFIMEIAFEVLREGGVRLPRPVGQAVSIVGALVIGEAAYQAGIVSRTMVIVVAITGIASFAVPAVNAANNVRLLRFPMMILGASLGVYGIVIGLLILLIHTSDLRSVGIPYLSPMAPFNFRGWKDAFVRLPLWLMDRRPSFIHPQNSRRMKRGLKPEPPKKKKQ